MKLKNTHDWRRPHRALSISDAVQAQCTDSGSDDMLSELRYNLDNTAKVLGTLIETLHTNNLITNADVLRCLPRFNEMTQEEIAENKANPRLR